MIASLLVRLFGRAARPPQDDYRNAWASQLEAERERSAKLDRKNRELRTQLRIRQLRMWLAGLTGAGLACLTVTAGGLGYRFFTPHPCVTTLDEFHIVGRVPVSDADEGTVCSTGEIRACLTGLRGVCAAGTQTCSADGRVWTPCLPQVGASTEVADGIDNDCDGIADEVMHATLHGRCGLRDAVRQCETGEAWPYDDGIQACGSCNGPPYEWSACVVPDRGSADPYSSGACERE